MSKVKDKSILVSLPVDVVSDLDNIASMLGTSRNGLIKLACMSFLADYTLHVMEKTVALKS